MNECDWVKNGGKCILEQENQELKADYGNKAQVERDLLLEENKKLKKQLEYLISGEYLNQLRFERGMLENIVQNGEVSKEDKEFIDMTHRNTELLNQQKEFIEYLEDKINKIKEQIRTYDIWHEVGVDINFLILKKQLFTEDLAKYKELIGAENDRFE